MRRLLLLSLLVLSASAPAPTAKSDWHFVAGGFEPGRGPDGNSVFLDAPEGLILVDTGRHAAHQEKLIAWARQRGRPIAAVLNTHWHLDHSGGNAEILAEYPKAPVWGTAAVDGALTGFFPQSRRSAEQFIASGQASKELEAEIRRDMAAMDHPSLRPTRLVRRSETARVAGRKLQLNLAPFAATEADLWIWDEKAKLLIAGDLVVGLVPFMDTACPEGWRKALNALADKPFRTLIPGHGEPMTRPQFLVWRAAFNNLLDCAASERTKESCAAGWKSDAAAFIPAGERRVEEMVGYYIDSRLRAAPAERERYCKPLR